MLAATLIITAATVDDTCVSEAVTPVQACLPLLPPLSLDRRDAPSALGQRGHAKVGGGTRSQRSRRPRATGGRRSRATEVDRSCPAAWATAKPIKRWVKMVIDSGSTWHVHNNRDDLTNQRDCHDTINDAQGNLHTCDCIGDLTLLARDKRGREVSFTLRDVRCIQGFEDPLISVDQLWSGAKVDARFRDLMHMEFTRSSDSNGNPICVGFGHDSGLLRLHCAVLRPKGGARRPLPPTQLPLPPDQCRNRQRRTHPSSDRAYMPLPAPPTLTNCPPTTWRQ